MKTRDGKGGSGSEGCGTARGAPGRPRERKGAISRRPRERKDAISRRPRERKDAISLRSRVSTAVATMAVTEASRVRCAGRGRRRRRACGLVLLLRNISNNPRHCGPGKCCYYAMAAKSSVAAGPERVHAVIARFSQPCASHCGYCAVMTGIAGLLRCCGVYCGRCGGTSACTSTSSRTW